MLCLCRAWDTATGDKGSRNNRRDDSGTVLKEEERTVHTRSQKQDGPGVVRLDKWVVRELVGCAGGGRRGTQRRTWHVGRSLPCSPRDRDPLLYLYLASVQNGHTWWGEAGWAAGGRRISREIVTVD